VSTVVGEIAVVGWSVVKAERRQMSREPDAPSVIGDDTPVTPDGPVMSRPVSNGDDVTLGVGVRLLVLFEGGADRVELWERRAVVDAVGRGGRLVVAGFIIQVERSRLVVVVVWIGATAYWTDTCNDTF